jgi:hypothetical protein
MLTMPKISAIELKINGTRIPEADIDKIRAEPATFSTGMTVVQLFGGSSYAPGGSLELKAAVDGKGAGAVRQIFQGTVVSVEPADLGGKKITRLMALDPLHNQQFLGPPSPLEMIDFLSSSDRVQYRHGISRMLNGKSNGVDQILNLPTLRRVLRAIPGGYALNAEKFKAELAELMSETPEERRMLTQAMWKRSQDDLENAWEEGRNSVVYVYDPAEK